MKTFTKILTAATALFLATGCINEDPAYKNAKDPEVPGSTGYLVLSEMTMRVVRDDATDTQPDDTGDKATASAPSSRAEDPQPADDSFVVVIYNADNDVVLQTTYGEMQSNLTTPIELPVGNYQMKVYSEDPATIPAVAWSHPVYGAVRDFSVTKQQSTTIGEVICTLQNIKVTLVCSADLAADLSETTESIITLGDASITFVKGEARAAYFMPSDKTTTMEFRLSGTFIEGGNASFTKDISDVKAGQWRKITLVITHASQGEAKLDIKVSTFVLDDEVVVNGTDGLWEMVFDEEPAIIAPVISWPEHDLTKPFKLLPSMFSLQNGLFVCTEPMKFDLTSTNGLGSLKVTITSTNTEFMASLAAYGLPDTFDLCTITAENPAYEILHSFGFPLGDQVTHATQIDIAAAMPLLYKYPGYDGTHTFTIEATDLLDVEAINPGTAALRIIVDRKTVGPAPTIVWKELDIEKQHVVTSDMLINIDITTSTGITAMQVIIDSDELSPQLPAMGIPIDFDLCNIEGDINTFGTLAYILGNPEQGLGFPINEAVKGKTIMPFSISKFVPMLLSIPGEHNFILAVTDGAGQTTTKTVKLKVNDSNE